MMGTLVEIQELIKDLKERCEFIKNNSESKQINHSDQTKQTIHLMKVIGK